MLDCIERLGHKKQEYVHDHRVPEVSCSLANKQLNSWRLCFWPRTLQPGIATILNP